MHDGFDNTTHPSDEQLFDLLSGELDAASERAVRAHMEACAQCAAEVTAAGILVPELASATEPLGETASVRMHSALAQEWDSRAGARARASERRSGWGRKWWHFNLGLAAGAAVLVLGMVAVLGSFDDKKVSRTFTSPEQEKAAKSDDADPGSAAVAGGIASEGDAADSSTVPSAAAMAESAAEPESGEARGREAAKPRESSAADADDAGSEEKSYATAAPSPSESFAVPANSSCTLGNAEAARGVAVVYSRPLPIFGSVWLICVPAP